jgi:hypothetical protein
MASNPGITVPYQPREGEVIDDLSGKRDAMINIRNRIKIIIYISTANGALFTTHTLMIHSLSVHHRHLSGSFWIP